MRVLLGMLAMAIAAVSLPAGADGVRLKEIARIQGVRDNHLTGYGLVIGLAGSGDSAKSRLTIQSVANALSHFGVNISPDDLISKNVAAVMVTATLPPFAESGEKIDVSVSSLGDARSLTGGTLLLAPLNGPDGNLYALAQGPVSVGGYDVRAFGTSEQKNHPTVGRIPGGGDVERAAPVDIQGNGSTMDVLLYQPDFTTAERAAEALRRSIPGATAVAEHAGKISVHFGSPPGDLVRAISMIENVTVIPDQVARVVVNERTGTVVAGGDVRLGSVTISQGDLRIAIQTDYQVSQPDGVYVGANRGISTAIVPEAHISTSEPDARVVSIREGATVADLVTALHTIHISTRDVITVLQSIKAAGALRGDLVIQ
jgi:flagellar P-ring protein precursor FlgI